MISLNSKAVIYIPGHGYGEAMSDSELCNHLRATTHLGIGAHPDDVEFMMWQGILQCHSDCNKHFASVVVTDGQGSSRVGPYASFDDEQMVKVRLEEQRRVAEAGGYSATISLGYTSLELRKNSIGSVCEDIRTIVKVLRPQVIYTHNLADRHDSHVATALRTIEALRELGPEYYPQEFYGCEVWRSLDWLTGSDRCTRDVSEHPNLMRALMGIYDSQIAGGKGYDIANFGRRQGNATYNDAYHPDESSLMELAMDLKPLLIEKDLTPELYFERLNDNFRRDVADRLSRMAGC